MEPESEKIHWPSCEKLGVEGSAKRRSYIENTGPLITGRNASEY
jgi:hypothetical protein